MPLPGQRPASAPFGVRTFHARKGRLSPAKRRALAELLPARALRPDEQPSALDLGCGTGEAALALAEARPDWLVLAVDVHSASLASFLLRAAARPRPPANLRVHQGDGVELLARRIEPASLHLLRVLFPDPWPKARHRHRRLVQAPFATLAADRLAPGGMLELATDRADYAQQMAAVLDAGSGLVRSDEEAPRPATFYGTRAETGGRTVHELRYRR